MNPSTSNITPDQIERIAHVSYEANRALAFTCDEFSQLAWALAPIEVKSAYRGYARSYVENPLTSVQQLHEDWRQRKYADGWTHGDGGEKAREHNWLLPYSELRLEQKLQYEIFRGVVEAFRRAAGGNIEH